MGPKVLAGLSSAPPMAASDVGPLVTLSALAVARSSPNISSGFFDCGQMRATMVLSRLRGVAAVTGATHRKTRRNAVVLGKALMRGDVECARRRMLLPGQHGRDYARTQPGESPCTRHRAR